MSEDDKPKPIDDLKQGLGLLFRAAKGVAQNLPTEKIEEVVMDGAKEVGRAFESLGQEIEKTWNKATGTSPPPRPAEDSEGSATDRKEEHADDAYAPEPPKGPRVG